jgi:hypothetical protein
LLVFDLMRLLEVLAAVEFNDKAGVGAVEVDDVGADGFLAVERLTVDLFAAEALPEVLFGVGLVAAKRSGEGFLGGEIGFHVRVPG